MISRRGRTLDSLKNESKGVTNETPTCAVPVHALQTNAFWWGVGEGGEGGDGSERKNDKTQEDFGTNNRCWGAKLPNAQSDCIPIQIVGLFWVVQSSKIIRRREQSDRDSATHGKIAVKVDYSWSPITSNSARGVACASLRRLGYLAQALGLLPKNIFVLFIFCFAIIPLSPLHFLSFELRVSRLDQGCNDLTRRRNMAQAVCVPRGKLRGPRPCECVFFVLFVSSFRDSVKGKLIWLGSPRSDSMSEHGIIPTSPVSCPSEYREIPAHRNHVFDPAIAACF